MYLIIFSFPSQILLYFYYFFFLIFFLPSALRSPHSAFSERGITL